MEVKVNFLSVLIYKSFIYLNTYMTNCNPKSLLYSLDTLSIFKQIIPNKINWYNLHNRLDMVICENKNAEIIFL
jgi:hypothetical protein